MYITIKAVLQPSKLQGSIIAKNIKGLSERAIAFANATNRRLAFKRTRVQLHGINKKPSMLEGGEDSETRIKGVGKTRKTYLQW